MIHELKILPEFFAAEESKRKPFEVRKNDRNYQVGDILALNEWDVKGYTGKSLLREVTFVLNDERYCKEGFVIMGIKPLWMISEENLTLLKMNQLEGDT